MFVFQCFHGFFFLKSNRLQYLMAQMCKNDKENCFISGERLEMKSLNIYVLKDNYVTVEILNCSLYYYYQHQSFIWQSELIR